MTAHCQHAHNGHQLFLKLERLKLGQKKKTPKRLFTQFAALSIVGEFSGSVGIQRHCNFR